MNRMTRNKASDKKKSRFKQNELKITFTAKNAERERSRVKSLRNAFQSLQSCLPSVPPNTKLSKLDVLILATNYISYLTKLLSGDEENHTNTSNTSTTTTSDCNLKFFHPIKKWPMRSRLYSISELAETNSVPTVNLYSSNGYHYEMDSNNDFLSNYNSFV